MFSINYEPVHGIIYKNSKKEKRVMRHLEIHKFCDATLNRVLEGLMSYTNDVKYGYVQRELTNDEVEYLKLFEEEIEIVLSVAPTTLSFQKVPIDKVPWLRVQHQVSNRFEIPLVELEEDPASPQGIHQENIRRLVRPEVASPSTCLQFPSWKHVPKR
ncbi:hypothetical protein Tco_0797518 [Tanacetum coccineum]